MEARASSRKAKAVSAKAQAKRKLAQVFSRKPQAVKIKTEAKSRTGGRKTKFSRRKLREEIMREARVLGRHMGATEIYVDKVVEQVARWAETREIVTEDDITRVASEKLKRYDEDLAFLYGNRGKII